MEELKPTKKRVEKLAKRLNEIAASYENWFLMTSPVRTVKITVGLKSYLKAFKVKD